MQPLALERSLPVSVGKTGPSPVGLIALKHRVLNPLKANKISEIDKVLTEWRKDRRQVEEDDLFSQCVM